MKDLIDKIFTKVEKIDSRLDSIDKTLVKQHENLKEHMRRTELLEKQQEKLIHEELVPVKAHIEQVKGISKFVAFAIPLTIAIITIVYQYKN